MIKDNPKQFLYFTQPTNKGTIYTAQMLVEATNPEEIAAIWIAATAFELINTHIASGIAQYANELYYSAVLFLRERFYIWHHAIRKLVPDVLIPYDVLNSIQCENAETVMGLIQMNVLLLKSSYAILCYSSISDTELEKEKPRSLRLERQS